MVFSPQKVVVLLVLLIVILLLLAVTVLKQYILIPLIAVLVVSCLAIIIAARNRNIGSRGMLLIVAIPVLSIVLGFLVGFLFH